MVPYEAFLAEKPVVTTTDAGGPLEVVADRATGLVCEPRAEALAARLRVAARHADDARAWGRAGRELAERVTGTPRSSGCWHEGRLLLAAAALALGDRRLLRAAPARARASGSTSSSPAPAASARAPSADVASTTSATTRTRTAGSSRRCAGARASSSCTSSCSITWSRASPSPAGTSTATSPRWSATPASSAACSATPSPTPGSTPLWETRPQDFPLAGEVLDLAAGLVVHSRYVEERAREAGYGGPIWRIPMPAWPVPARRARARSRAAR